MSKRRERRNQPSGLKATVLRRYYVDEVLVSDLAEECNLQPSLVSYGQ